VEETVTPPPPSPTATLVSDVLGPPTGDGPGDSQGGTVLVLIAALIVAGTSTAALALSYRRLR
jgi:hypothetical protein